MTSDSTHRISPTEGMGISRPQTRTLREWVLNQLTELIMNGTMYPGYRMVEANLSAELGVSRSPLREALRQLEQDGLITTLPNTSTIVSPIRRTDIEQIYEIRIGLEPLMAGYAAAHHYPAPLESCYRLNLELKDAVNGVDFAKLDFAMHQGIWAMASRDRIAASLRSISRQAQRQLALGAQGLTDEGRQQSYEEHRLLLDAISEGNAATATVLMREHLTSGRSRILSVLKEDVT